MPESENPLQGLGIKLEGLDRIRLGRGVIGKASYVAAAAIFGLIVVALALRDSTLLLIIGTLIAAVFAIYFFGALWFSNKHPGVALLEGAELIQWRQLEVAASNPTLVIENSKIDVPPLIEDGRLK
jgi:ABC-type branched-subunit amino acid transport system permease subunit